MDEKLMPRGEEAACRRRESTDDGTGGLFASIRAAFPVKEMNLRTYSPLTLAFIGDGIYDLVIRSLVVGQGNTSPNTLHRHTSRLVRAESQAEMVDALLPELSDEERDWYRRGQNAKPTTAAKRASVADYHKATGFEALLGYLYLTGNEERMLALIRLGLQAIGVPEAGGPGQDNA